MSHETAIWIEGSGMLGYTLARAEELDVPVLDAGSLDPRFLIDTEVEFHVLRDGGIELGTAIASGHRFFRLAHP